MHTYRFKNNCKLRLSRIREGCNNISKKDILGYISRPDLLNESGFYLIYLNPPQSTPDPPSNAPIGFESPPIQA